MKPRSKEFYEKIGRIFTDDIFYIDNNHYKPKRVTKPFGDWCIEDDQGCGYDLTICETQTERDQNAKNN